MKISDAIKKALQIGAHRVVSHGGCGREISFFIFQEIKLSIDELTDERWTYLIPKTYSLLEAVNSGKKFRRLSNNGWLMVAKKAI